MKSLATARIGSRWASSRSAGVGGEIARKRGEIALKERLRGNADTKAPKACRDGEREGEETEKYNREGVESREKEQRRMPR
eukprot:4907275-Pleurochrysis_carterae.AAC.1